MVRRPDMVNLSRFLYDVYEISDVRCVCQCQEFPESVQLAAWTEFFARPALGMAVAQSVRVFERVREVPGSIPGWMWL